MTDGQWQIVIGVVAIVVAVIGIVAARSISKRRHITQRQRTGENSVSIQSGRDTNVDRIK